MTPKTQKIVIIVLVIIVIVALYYLYECNKKKKQQLLTYTPRVSEQFGRTKNVAQCSSCGTIYPSEDFASVVDKPCGCGGKIGRVSYDDTQKKTKKSWL